MFQGFSTHDIDHAGVRLRAWAGGAGPPLLLLHGHPQTHAMWHAVVGPLAQRFRVIAMDLRGRGDSQRIAASTDHAAYSKRAMAADAIAVMRHFGIDRFAVCAHDRGARVAHRLALDHPAAVSRLMLLDIAPTLAMYEGTTDDFARAYWHWFFLIQDAPMPERAIEADPLAWLREGMGRRFAGLGPFSAEAMAEYERCIAMPGSASAICEDYRASATIDLEHDRADRAGGHRVRAPLRVLWGANGVVARCFDVLQLWRAAADEVSGTTLDCGHYLAEERPAELLAEMFDFFGDDPP
jgi:haloacetate dehalogenase